MNQTSVFNLIVIFLLILFLSSDKIVFANSGINRKINFQGKVVNIDNTNVVDGNYDFTFKIYDSLSAGTSLWSEIWSSENSQVPVVSGIFSVDLGTMSTFPPSVDFNTDNIFLTLSFNGDQEMTPRIQMAAVPYAINAEKVSGLTVSNTTGVLNIPDGKTISFSDSFVTIGTGISLNQSLSSSDSPNFTGLNVNGNFTVGGSLSMTAIPAGVGTTVLYISSSGVVSRGTLPVTNVANSKVIVLSPEYAGASLSADGSGTTAVSMTSDNSLNTGGVGWKNYYELSSVNVSIQDYSVIVRITLPSDFGSWQTGSCPGTTCALEFSYQTGLATTADNAISYIVSNDIDTPATAVCSIGATAATAWNKSGCVESVLNDNSAPEWDGAGETAVIRIKMAAKNTASALTRAGDITLRYVSSF